MIFNCKTPYSGYVRGEVRFEVEADTKEEALEKAQAGDYLWGKKCTMIRDDTNIDWEDSEVIAHDRRDKAWLDKL